MSNAGGIDVTAAQWRPRLIRLTQIPGPTGEPRTIYVDPAAVHIVMESFGAISEPRPTPDEPSRREWGQFRNCTSVCAAGHTLLVSETADHVSMLVGRAFGYDAGPVSVPSGD